MLTTSRSTTTHLNPLVQVWWCECRTVSPRSTNGWAATDSNLTLQRRSWSGLDPLGGWSTARLVNSTSRGFPLSRLRTSVTLALWLTMICRCKLTSTMLHELASTICVNCESSGALSRQTRLTSSSELLCTADSITAMGSSPVCFSTRSIGFNPFSVPQLALFLAYPSRPAFRTPCTMNYTGSPSQKGSSSNSVASFTSVYTRAHPGICLNTAYRSLRSLVDHTWDLRRPVTCLYQPPPPRQLALVDSFMLVQQLGTVSLLVWRTLIYLFWCLKNCLKLNFSNIEHSRMRLCGSLLERRRCNTV